MAQQLAIAERNAIQPKLLVISDPGTGKTYATLLRMLEERMLTLVLAPKSVVEAAWCGDMEWAPELEPVLYRGTPKQRTAIRESLRRCGYGELSRKVLLTNPQLFLRDAEPLLELGLIGRLVVDESTCVKNPDSQTTKAVRPLADRAREVQLLTGTPAPQGPQDYWSQLRMIDPNTGGLADAPTATRNPPSFYRWAGYWLSERMAYVHKLGKNVITGYDVKPEREEDFNRMLERAAIRISKDVCLDLPDKQFQIMPVEMSAKERKAYSAMQEEAEEILEDDTIDERERETRIGGLAMRLRQFTCGTMRDPETDEWSKVSTSKTDAMIDLIETTLAGEPVVIWTQFRAEAAEVMRRLSNTNRNAALCDGSTSREIPQNIRDFVAGDLNTLVCHPAAMGHGVTLVKCGGRPCRFSIYHSMGYSTEHWLQSQDRIHRKGQTSKCTYYVMEAMGTVDQTIRMSLANKVDASRAVLDALRGRFSNDGTGASNK